MEIHIQSDGQLYPPKKLPQKSPPPPPQKALPKEEENHWEDFLLIAVGVVLLWGKEGPDIPLLLALAYILFDKHFSLEKLL